MSFLACVGSLTFWFALHMWWTKQDNKAAAHFASITVLVSTKRHHENYTWEAFFLENIFTAERVKTTTRLWVYEWTSVVGLCCPWGWVNWSLCGVRSAFARQVRQRIWTLRALLVWEDDEIHRMVSLTILLCMEKKYMFLCWEKPHSSKVVVWHMRF